MISQLRGARHNPPIHRIASIRNHWHCAQPSGFAPLFADRILGQDAVRQNCAIGFRCAVPDNGPVAFSCLPDEGGQGRQNTALFQTVALVGLGPDLVPNSKKLCIDDLPKGIDGLCARDEVSVNEGGGCS